MKKKLVLIMALTMMVSLTGCSILRDYSETNQEDDSDDDDDDDDDDDKDEDGGSSSGNSGAGSSSFTIKDDEDGYATFSISVTEPIDCDSWLGLCTEGEYLYERDADEYDVTYTYPENYFDDNANPQAGPYTYVLDYGYLDEGDYTLVLTNTDVDGFVIFYVPCTIKNDELIVKNDEIVYNSRPSDIDPVDNGSDIYGGTTDPIDDPGQIDYPDTGDDGSSGIDDGTVGGGDTYTDPSDDYVSDPLEFAEVNYEIMSPYDAVGVSIPNDTLVLKYVGTENTFGESELYYVLGGFYENGDVNWLTGTSRLWYFFDSEESYTMAFEMAMLNDDLIIKDYNPVSHYFSVIYFFMNDWETYDGIVESVDAGIIPENMQPSPDYVVVK